jgi:hypothetical protein
MITVTVYSHRVSDEDKVTLATQAEAQFSFDGGEFSVQYGEARWLPFGRLAPSDGEGMVSYSSDPEQWMLNLPAISNTVVSYAVEADVSARERHDHGVYGVRGGQSVAARA